MTQKPAIPVEIRRQVLIEAGHRCAIQTCRNSANVDVHHIVPWEECKEHKAENLIALCPNCHRLVHDGKIDKKSQYKYKEICQKLTNPPLPSKSTNDTIKTLLKFDPNALTEIIDSENVIGLIDHGVLNFSIRFNKPFENNTYVVNAIGDGTVNFRVLEKSVEVIQILFEEPCPNIVRLEFKY